MNQTFRNCIILNLALFLGMPTQAQNLKNDPVETVIKAMTLEEKANLVVGNGFYLPEIAKLMPKMTANVRPEQKKIIGTAGTTFAIPRLGITSLAESDGPSGVNVYYQTTGRTYYATSWPTPILLASSWDTALLKKVGQAYGNEAKEYGIDIPLAPALNIHRNLLGGRNFEYYSEDPFLSGHLASAMVEGIQYNGIGSSIKHFAANNQETNRNSVNTIVSERALRELYLRGFEIAVKTSNPWTVMTSYNLINGKYTAENSDLLRTVLRDEWGFKGFVMTDWYGGIDPVAQIRSGNNLIMPGKPEDTQKIIDAVKGGSLTEKTLDENVAGILSVIKMSPTFKGYQKSDQPDLDKGSALAREAAAESMVLLKNNASLPVASNSHIISLFGSSSYDLIVGGSGSGTVNYPYKVSLAEGLARHGYTLEQKLYQAYWKYVGQELLQRPKKGFIQQFAKPYKPIEEFEFDDALLAQSADASNIAVISIGRVSGEGTDRKAEDFLLSEKEKQLITKVSNAFHAQNKKVVVVLNISGIIDVASWRDQVDGIVLAWLPGEEGGNAIADILSGKVNPSGKLASTIPVKYLDEPTAKNFPGKEFPKKDGEASTGVFTTTSIPAEVTYEEGIYVGYRYYNTFGVKPAYDFGYGLSYTTFDYSALKLSSENFKNEIKVSLKVTNTGKVAGKEIVQLYLTAPSVKLDKPASELKGFAKTKLLNPGDSEEISFVVSKRDLASFDTSTSSWIAESGKYTIKIGASSLNIKKTADFILDKELVVEKEHKVLVPQVKINELKNKKK